MPPSHQALNAEHLRVQECSSGHMESLSSSRSPPTSPPRSQTPPPRSPTPPPRSPTPPPPSTSTHARRSERLSTIESEQSHSHVYVNLCFNFVHNCFQHAQNIFCAHDISSHFNYFFFYTLVHKAFNYRIVVIMKILSSAMHTTHFNMINRYHSVNKYIII